MQAVPTRAVLERHGDPDGVRHGLQYGRNEFFILQQRRTGGLAADLLRRAAHVDIDDLGAAVDAGTGRVGHLCGLGTSDLDGDGFGVEVQIESMP